MSQPLESKTSQATPVDMVMAIAEVAQRSSRLMAQAIERYLRDGITVTGDERCV